MRYKPNRLNRVGLYDWKKYNPKKFSKPSRPTGKPFFTFIKVKRFFNINKINGETND